MKERMDDFETRRQHLAKLSDDELRTYFLELADKLVDPLMTLAHKNTSKSIERSVLLRMGFSSIEAKAIVDLITEKDLLKKGAGHCIYVISKELNKNLHDSGVYILEDKGIEFLMEYFGYYE